MKLKAKLLTTFGVLSVTVFTLLTLTILFATSRIMNNKLLHDLDNANSEVSHTITELFNNASENYAEKNLEGLVNILLFSDNNETERENFFDFVNNKSYTGSSFTYHTGC